MRARRPSPLLAFVVLYSVLYGAFGTSSPFLPRFFEWRGLSPEAIGLLFGLGTAVRLLAGPLVGRVADLLGAARAALALCLFGAVCVDLGLLRIEHVGVLVGVSLAQAACLAPTTTLADALAVAAAKPQDPERAGFEYGWVRGAASGAFVAGTIVAGRVLRTTPLDAILWMQAALLAVAGVAVWLVPALVASAADESADERSALGGVRVLLREAVFRRLIFVAALVLGSHAMHDAFAMVRWNAAGIDPGAGALLWSEAVLAEVLVFFVAGPALLARVGPGNAMTMAATAGVVRWTVMSSTTSLVALSLVQPLHGFTFALLHLACMRLIRATVSPHLAATAQSIYGVGAAAVTGSLTVASGVLYARLGGKGFLAMALLCALALPVAHSLRANVEAPAP